MFDGQKKRNFGAFLELIKSNNINVNDLITKRVPIEDFNSVYNNIDNKNNIATIFSYELKEEESFKNIITLNNANFKSEYPVFGIIGAGNFTKMTLLPVMTKIDAKIKTIASIGGLNSTELKQGSIIFPKYIRL